MNTTDPNDMSQALVTIPNVSQALISVPTDNYLVVQVCIF